MADDRKAEMTKRERKLYVEAKLAEMRDVAAGVLGSQGSTTLGTDHADVFINELGGEGTDLGGGGIEVSCQSLCEAVLDKDQLAEAEAAAAPTVRKGTKTHKKEKEGST